MGSLALQGPETDGAAHSIEPWYPPHTQFLQSTRPLDLPYHRYHRSYYDAFGHAPESSSKRCALGIDDHDSSEMELDRACMATDMERSLDSTRIPVDVASDINASHLVHSSSALEPTALRDQVLALVVQSWSEHWTSGPHDVAYAILRLVCTEWSNIVHRGYLARYGYRLGYAGLPLRYDFESTLRWCTHDAHIYGVPPGNHIPFEALECRTHASCDNNSDDDNNDVAPFCTSSTIATVIRTLSPPSRPPSPSPSPPSLPPSPSPPSLPPVHPISSRRRRRIVPSLRPNHHVSASHVQSVSSATQNRAITIPRFWVDAIRLLLLHTNIDADAELDALIAYTLAQTDYSTTSPPLTCLSPRYLCLDDLYANATLLRMVLSHARAMRLYCDLTLHMEDVLDSATHIQDSYAPRHEMTTSGTLGKSKKCMVPPHHRMAFWYNCMPLLVDLFYMHREPTALALNPTNATSVTYQQHSILSTLQTPHTFLYSGLLARLLMPHIHRGFNPQLCNAYRLSGADAIRLAAFGIGGLAARNRSRAAYMGPHAHLICELSSRVYPTYNSSGYSTDQRDSIQPLPSLDLSWSMASLSRLYKGTVSLIALNHALSTAEEIIAARKYLSHAYTPCIRLASRRGRTAIAQNPPALGNASCTMDDGMECRPNDHHRHRRHVDGARVAMDIVDGATDSSLSLPPPPPPPPSSSLSSPSSSDPNSTSIWFNIAVAHATLWHPVDTVPWRCTIPATPTLSTHVTPFAPGTLHPLSEPTRCSSDEMEDMSEDVIMPGPGEHIPLCQALFGTRGSITHAHTDCAEYLVRIASNWALWDTTCTTDDLYSMLACTSLSRDLILAGLSLSAAMCTTPSPPPPTSPTLLPTTPPLSSPYDLGSQNRLWCRDAFRASLLQWTLASSLPPLSPTLSSMMRFTLMAHTFALHMARRMIIPHLPTTEERLDALRACITWRARANTKRWLGAFYKACTEYIPLSNASTEDTRCDPERALRFLMIIRALMYRVESWPRTHDDGENNGESETSMRTASQHHGPGEDAYESKRRGHLGFVQASSWNLRFTLTNFLDLHTYGGCLKEWHDHLIRVIRRFKRHLEGFPKFATTSKSVLRLVANCCNVIVEALREEANPVGRGVDIGSYAKTLSCATIWILSLPFHALTWSMDFGDFVDSSTWLENNNNNNGSPYLPLRLLSWDNIQWSKAPGIQCDNTQWSKELDNQFYLDHYAVPRLHLAPCSRDDTIISLLQTLPACSLSLYEPSQDYRERGIYLYAVASTYRASIHLLEWAVTQESIVLVAPSGPRRLQTSPDPPATTMVDMVQIISHCRVLRHQFGTFICTHATQYIHGHGGTLYRHLSRLGRDKPQTAERLRTLGSPIHAALLHFIEDHLGRYVRYHPVGCSEEDHWIERMERSHFPAFDPFDTESNWIVVDSALDTRHVASLGVETPSVPLSLDPAVASQWMVLVINTLDCVTHHIDSLLQSAYVFDQIRAHAKGKNDHEWARRIERARLWSRLTPVDILLAAALIRFGALGQQSVHYNHFIVLIERFGIAVDRLRVSLPERSNATAQTRNVLRLPQALGLVQNIIGTVLTSI